MPLEKNLWLWLKSGTKHMPKLDLQRVENVCGQGYPDVDGCYDGSSFKLELKSVVRPARVTTPIRVKFQPAQIPWLKRRWACGGACFVLLRVGAGRDASRYLIRGCDADRLASGLKEVDIPIISIIPPDSSAVDIIQIAAAAGHRF